jgi:hypothetical protein
MIRCTRYFRLILFLIFCSESIFAQVEGTMPFMTSLPQVTYYNPAFKPNYKFSYGLPGSSVFTQYSNNGFNYNSFISNQNNVLTADLNKLYGALKDKNYINANIQADLLRFSLKVNPRLYITINATAKGYNRILLPKDLIGIFVNGTDAYVNKTATLSPKAEATEYLELGYGAAYTVNRKLTVGAKLKFLKGIVNATTQSASFDLTLADNYAITVKGNVDARTSGIHNLTQSGYTVSDHWQDYLKNNGVAFDVGGTYQVNDKLMVGLSLIDIGNITWRNDPYGYQLDPASAQYTFQGINLQDVLNGNSISLNSVSDSLQKKFTFTQGAIANYKTPLPGKIYLSGSYELRRALRVNALFFAEQFRGRTMPGFTTSLNKEFGRRLSTSLSYTITNNSFNNLGAGFSLNLPPIQIYLVGDNILRAAFAAAQKDLSSFANSTNYFNLRTGINFVFGWDKAPEKQPYPKALKTAKTIR